MPDIVSKVSRSQVICVTVTMAIVGASPVVSWANGEACALAEHRTTRENFHVYLLVGQSNMSGRGELSTEDSLPTPNVYSLDRNDSWIAASHPLHFDKPKIAGVGLGIDFAKQMLQAEPGIKIGLVPCAVGGTSLNQWRKGGELYENALARSNLAEKCGSLKGILWHQGEGDCGIKSASSYGQRLTQLVSDLRGDLGKPSLPFVLGEIGDFRVGVKRRSDLVIQQQQQVPHLVANTACVSAKGLGHKGDFSHFDAESLREFGKRYATAMKSLQTGKASVAIPTELE